LRQAYDYWQNQPGNYRAPGLATSAYFSAGESSKLLVGVHWERAARSAAGRAVGAVGGNPLSPSKFPRRLVRRTTPGGACDIEGLGGGPPRCVSQKASTARRYPPKLAEALGTAQPSTEPTNVSGAGRALTATEAVPVTACTRGYRLRGHQTIRL
jgi:hypothetical protein